MNLILASTSPYRKEQLERLNISFGCHSPNVDEEQFKGQIMDPSKLASTLARLKAESILERFPNDFIIGGDQVLNIKGKILGKPLTQQKAIEQLSLLSGQTHELITSTCYLSKDQLIERTVIAKMKMRPLSLAQITSYIELEQPLKCCGSYMLENKGIALFEEIDCPDYTAIIGLPLMSTAQILMENGFNVF
ncbi:septum formation protein Maf [Halobacteriovorax marinus]|mgnify:CR=1 FL=1|uniref:7-methyl-GTP pyrophosphatase n=1 Tax=Halobacteriovorax marinus TaxID=97084 RepID=A0A1Y5F3A8_9BACT|nr:septum formation protein Maf [Halobacteriovorax marinus]